jgi:hypothetical protein
VTEWLRAPLLRGRPARYLHEFSEERSGQYPFVDPLIQHYMHQDVNWLDLSRTKYLLFDWIEETLVTIRPYEMLARQLPLEIPGTKSLLIFYFYYTFPNVDDKALSSYENLAAESAGRYMYFYFRDEKEKHLEDYLSLIKSYWGIDWFILASFDKRLDQEFPALDEKGPDLFQILKESKTFMVYQADVLLALGRDKQLGFWPPAIQELMVPAS